MYQHALVVDCPEERADWSSVGGRAGGPAVVAAVAYATFVSQQRASGFGIAIGNRTITNPLIAFPLVIFLIASVIAFIRFARR
ncbi:MAG TPA: hypothetical protein VGQ71_05760 [Terriglobales bacterium]|jgi:hypothetical protein|nr:hypothetical protein [Terriglobales bacterium]